MESNLKLFLISCTFLYLSFWTFGSDSTQQGNIYEVKVAHAHGEHNIFDIIQAEDDPLPTTASTEAPPGTPIEANTTSSEECERTGSCCYQYTWPGSRFDNGNTNFTCDNYAKNFKSEEPCKLPIVFTYQNTTKGNRPNITELVKYTDATNYKIYCRKTSSCIKYSYFVDNAGGRKLWNETRFCGVVQSINKGTTIQKGCYEEKLGGYTKEVCVCNSDRCNKSSIISTPHALTLLLTTVLIAYMRSRN